MKITDDMLTEWRKQFEAEMQLEAALQATEVALSRHDDGTYRVPAVQSAWWGYQAGCRTTPDRDAIIEVIAAQWDGCMYQNVGQDIDIGAAIRDAAKRLLTTSTTASREES
ncbi:hypothetical protein [Burkholderia ubonensis]|uniref:hypothetical protein n=1 Tax=Burkholderia ubonensis TaxID=101571 RepID=UPI000756C8AA|nr:hypothetical protein [Burkholderia ubonensis]KWK75747.1 hypothetical protein WM15_29560 [Burkholderia ubonensis]